MKSIRFEVKMEAIGKPRMVHSDVWRKRPAVLKYRQWADELRLKAPLRELPAIPRTVLITCWIPMPDSWSKKKKEACSQSFHDGKPDVDNILKAVVDVLFKEDKSIGHAAITKHWCYPGFERMVIDVGGDDE